MTNLRDDLKDLLKRGGPTLEPLPSRLVIYGAGSSGKIVAEAAQRQGREVIAFLDARAATVPEVEGIPCHPPESAESRILAASGLPVVLAVFNYAADTGAIAELLRALGFSRIISYYEIHETLVLEPQFWLTRRSFCQEREDKILAAFDLFEDTISQQIFFDHIALRLTFDLELFREPDISNQYSPRDLPAPVLPLRLIDGGAFTGDTLEFFLHRGVAFGAVAAFEPDPDNYRDLAFFARKHLSECGEAAFFPCGLGEHTEMLRFHAGAGEGSMITTRGEMRVQVVSLDEALPNFRPSLIKLDIEGAEVAALRGAAQMIGRDHPNLAVCLYHSPDDLWTIPLLMRKLGPNKQMALRYHRFNGLEIVAYAFDR